MGLGDTMPRIGALVRGTMNRFIPNRTRVLELREDRVLPPPYDDQPDIQEYRSVPEDTPGPSKLQTGTSLVSHQQPPPYSKQDALSGGSHIYKASPPTSETIPLPHDEQEEKPLPPSQTVAIEKLAESRGVAPAAQTAEVMHTYTLSGHSDLVTSVQYSPYDTELISASRDKTIRIWDATAREEISVFHSPSQVNCVAFSPNAGLIATACYDNRLFITDSRTGISVQAFNGHSDEVTSVAFSPDGSEIASASYDKTVRVWTVITNRSNILRRVLAHHSDWVTSVAWSPDGGKIASGSFDNSVLVWDWGGAVVWRTLEGHRGAVTSVAFSPDGARVYSGSWDKTIRVWDIAAGVQAMVLRGHSAEVTSIAVSPDGTRIVSGSYEDVPVRLWDTATGEELMKLDGHSLEVTSVAFSAEGTEVAFGSNDGTVRLWDVSSGRSTAGLDAHTLSPEIPYAKPDPPCLLVAYECAEEIRHEIPEVEPQTILIYKDKDDEEIRVELPVVPQTILTFEDEHDATITTTQSSSKHPVLAL